MRAIGILALVLLLAACGKKDESPPPQTGRFAAVAATTDGTAAAFTLDGASEQAADESALKKCRHAAKSQSAACEVKGRITQGCLAAILGSAARRQVSVGQGATAGEACANAVATCRSTRGADCTGTTVGCTDGRPMDLCGLREEQTASPRPAAAPAPAPEQAQLDRPAGPFGAIAVGKGGDRAGTSFALATRADAEAAAVESCRGTGKNVVEDCESKVWFQNACGALAGGKDGAYGTGWANSPAQACRWAVSTCRKAGGVDCEGRIYSCSPRDVWGSCDGKFSAKH